MKLVPAQTAAIVLAAGASTRLGSPKQLVPLAGEPLLLRAVRMAVTAGCCHVIVVLGAQYEVIARTIQAHAAWTASGVELLFNDAWQQGMASSIRCGVAHLETDPQITGTLVLTCDQPLITPAHLAALGHHADGQTCATAYAGRQGVPAYFPRSDFSQLHHLQGDAGARALLRGGPAVMFEDAAFDVDHTADVEALKTFSGL